MKILESIQVQKTQSIRTLDNLTDDKKFGKTIGVLKSGLKFLLSLTQSLIFCRRQDIWELQLRCVLAHQVIDILAASMRRFRFVLVYV